MIYHLSFLLLLCSRDHKVDAIFVSAAEPNLINHRNYRQAEVDLIFAVSAQPNLDYYLGIPPALEITR